MTEQELLDLKQEITEAKESKNKLEARRDLLMDQLKEKFGVSTIAGARKKAKQLQEEVQEWEQKIAEATEELEAKLNDNE